MSGATQSETATLKAGADQAVPQPWDRLEGEPEASYSRFLLFLSLGPARTIEVAYNLFAADRKKMSKGAADSGGKKLPTPGNWCADSVAYRWIERAHAHDVVHLRRAGEVAVVKFVAVLQDMADRLLAALKEGTVQPTNWQDALEAINVLGGYLPQEAIRQVEHRQPVGVSKRNGLPSSN